MTDMCGICSLEQSLSDLKRITDNGLEVQIKLNSAFKVDLDLDKMSVPNICGSCLDQLEASYSFYQQIVSVQSSLEIAIKQEDIDTSSILTIIKEETKEESEDSLECFLAGPSYNSSAHFAIPWKVTEQASERPRKTPRKLLKTAPATQVPNSKKGRGLRAYRQAVPYTMASVFAEEISNKNFRSQTEVMTLTNDDKNSNGELTETAKAQLVESLWSNFDWSCSTCNAPFNNIIELNQHLNSAHKLKHRDTCVQCKKDTLHYAGYLNHAVEHNPSLKFCCVICSDYRSNLLDLFKHCDESHKNAKVFFCLYCGLHFFSGAVVNDHVKRKHMKASTVVGPKFQCDFCGFESILKDKMTQHLNNHKPRLFYCDQCAMSFTTTGYLNTHMKDKHEDAKIICPTCGKHFNSKKKFRIHNRMVHLKIKNHTCKVCGKEFYLNQTLRKHLQIHDPNAKGGHQCPYCPRSFKNHSSYQYHVRTHTGERPYRCPIEGCEKQTFVDYSNTKKHIKECHKSDAKPFKV